MAHSLSKNVLQTASLPHRRNVLEMGGLPHGIREVRIFHGVKAMGQNHVVLHSHVPYPKLVSMKCPLSCRRDQRQLYRRKTSPALPHILRPENRTIKATSDDLEAAREQSSPPGCHETIHSCSDQSGHDLSETQHPQAHHWLSGEGGFSVLTLFLVSSCIASLSNSICRTENFVWPPAA